MVTITDEFLKKGMTDKGSWTKQQLALLGVKWPPKGGWKYWLIKSGAKITDAKAKEFLSLGGIGPLFTEEQGRTVEK